MFVGHYPTTIIGGKYVLELGSTFGLESRGGGMRTGFYTVKSQSITDLCPPVHQWIK